MLVTFSQIFEAAFGLRPADYLADYPADYLRPLQSPLEGMGVPAPSIFKTSGEIKMTPRDSPLREMSRMAAAPSP